MEQPIRIRIRFITVLAVFMIVTAGGGILLWGAQNVLFHFVLDAEQLPFTRPEVAAKLPPSIGFLLGHLHLFLAAMLGLSMFAFLTGLGLLIRSNAARLAFILLLIIGIGWNLGMLYLQHLSTSQMVDLALESGLPVTEDTATYAFALGAGVSVLLSLLYLWLIGWLMSARVKAEFGVYR